MLLRVLQGAGGSQPEWPGKGHASPGTLGSRAVWLISLSLQSTLRQGPKGFSCTEESEITTRGGRRIFGFTLPSWARQVTR